MIPIDYDPGIVLPKLLSHQNSTKALLIDLNLISELLDSVIYLYSQVDKIADYHIEPDFGDLSDFQCFQEGI